MPRVSPAEISEAVSIDQPVELMTYDQFLAERQRIVDARQRAQQRFGQMVTGGAAGALILSITLLDRFATPPTMLPLLLGLAWSFLLASLLCSLVAQHYSGNAFDEFLREFDNAMEESRYCELSDRSARMARRLIYLASWLFITGVLALAVFAYCNLLYWHEA